jgi:hypothetical protein
VVKPLLLLVVTLVALIVVAVRVLSRVPPNRQGATTGPVTPDAPLMGRVTAAPDTSLLARVKKGPEPVIPLLRRCKSPYALNGKHKAIVV